MEKPTPIWPDGISFFRPKEGAPEWIKGSVSVNAAVFAEFLRNNTKHLSERGFLTLDLKISKNTGNPYFEVNTWKPKNPNITEKDREILNSHMERHNKPKEEINPEDVPW
jgi:hypothetical protein